MANVDVAKLALALDADLTTIEEAVGELRDAGWVAERPANGGDVLLSNVFQRDVDDPAPGGQELWPTRPGKCA